MSTRERGPLAQPSGRDKHRSAPSGSPNEKFGVFLLAQAYRALGRTQDAQAEMTVLSRLEESAREDSRVTKGNPTGKNKEP